MIDFPILCGFIRWNKADWIFTDIFPVMNSVSQRNIVEQSAHFTIIHSENSS